MGRFPLLARAARPADVDPGGANQIGTSERSVVTVAVAAATDALHRAMLSYIAGGAGAGVGLRAGTFQTDWTSSPWTLTLTGCAFATDVTASGTLAWTWADGTFVADLVVGGPGTAGGTLHIEGITWVPGPVGNFKITGILGGKQVAVLVPSA